MHQAFRKRGDGRSVGRRREEQKTRLSRAKCGTTSRRMLAILPCISFPCSTLRSLWCEFLPTFSYWPRCYSRLTNPPRLHAVPTTPPTEVFPVCLLMRPSDEIDCGGGGRRGAADGRGCGSFSHGWHGWGRTLLSRDSRATCSRRTVYHFERETIVDIYLCNFQKPR